MTVFGQADVIKASGGTDLSIDSVATQGFSPLDGPTIRETASGQLAEGGTIILTLTNDYTWNTNLTADDLTITVSPTGAANTKLEASFSGFNSSIEAVFTIDKASTTNGNGQGPGRIEIQGLELRPTTTDVPSEGQISNTGTTGPDTNYGNLSTAVGTITQVRVETAADGSGQIVPSQNILAGESLTVYAIARDVGDNFIKNIALNSSSDWTLTGGNGELSQAALTPAGNLKSATLSSEQTGTAKIEAAYSGATSVLSELITVQPRETQSLTINTQPSDTVTAGELFPVQPVIYLRDQFGNKVTTDDTTEVTASISSGNGILSENGPITITASSGEVNFSNLYAIIADTITLKFESTDLDPVSSNQVIVTPATASDLSYVQQPTNTAQNSTITPAVELQLLDQYGNKVKQDGISVSINDESFFKNNSTLSSNTDTQGRASFNDLNISNNATEGEVTIASQFSGISSPVDSEPFLIIGGDQLARYEITNNSGETIGQQKAGTSFDITVTAKDGNGDNFSFSSDSTLTITADNTIQGGSFEVTIPGGSSSVTTSITLTSTGNGKIYADQGESISGESNSFDVTPSNTIDLGLSTITANPAEITADGNSTSTITVQLKDEFGNNLETGGETVELSTTAGTLNNDNQTITANDEGDGTYTAVLTSSNNAGVTANVTGEVNGNSISDDATVDFVPGEVTTFTISLPQTNGSPSTQTAGSPFNIDVNAVDAEGNTVTGFDGSVTFSSNSTISTGNSASFTEGKLTDHSITLTEAGSSITITITADDLYNVSKTSDTFEVIAGSPDASTSVVTTTPTTIQNDGSSESVISVILNDTFGNRIYQENSITVSLEQLEENNTTTGNGTSPDATLSNGSDTNSNIHFNTNQGVYRDTLTSTSTVELIEVTSEFGDSSPTAINQTPTIDIVVPNTWTANAGGPSGNRTDWTNPENWSQGEVPDQADFVIIPDISDLPILDLNIAIGSFEVQAGASLTLFGGNAIDVAGNTIIDGSLNIEDNTELKVDGNLTGQGDFTAGKSTSINVAGDISLSNFSARTSNSQVTLDGTSPQIISTTNFLAQNLNIKNDVNADANTSLIDTYIVSIDDGKTFELNQDASDTLDVSEEVTGLGTLLINNNTLVLGGNIDLQNIDASQGTVIFGVRQGRNPSNFELSRQQISNLSDMKNAVVNNDHDVKTLENIAVDGTLTLENGNLIISSGKSLIAPNQTYNNGSLEFLRTINSRGWIMLSSPINARLDSLTKGLTLQGINGTDNPDKQPNLLYYKESAQCTDSNGDPVSCTDNQRWRKPGDASSKTQDIDQDGRGYFYYVFGDSAEYDNPLPVTLSISGEEFKNDSTQVHFSSVSYTPSSDTVDANVGWNLVGNPWGATLDWDDSNWTKTNIDNVVYVWDPSTNSYLTWNGIDGSLSDGLIKPFQAFWVKSSGQNPKLAVDQSGKTTGGQFYKKSQRKPASVGFKLAADTLQKMMHLTLSPDGKNSKDNRDGYRLLPFDTSTYLELYTTLDDGTQLAINNLARSFGKEISIPLHVGGFKNGQPLNGDYTLSWPDFGDVPDAWTLILEDKKTGQKVNLRKNTFYSFDLSQSKSKAPVASTIENFRLIQKPQTQAKAKSSSENRFVLNIKPGADAAGIPNEYSLGINYPNPFSEQTTIKYNTPVEGEVQLLIYDILGRRVKTILNERQPADFHEADWNPNGLASGIYLCVMRAGGKQFTRKITYIK